MRSSWRSGLALLGAIATAPARGASEVKNVAIIGAGAAGSSAAYHLQKYAEEEGLSINITIFEKTHHIGGRTLTVEAFDEPSQPIELGASIFVTINHILYNASQEFDLPLGEPYEPEKGSITAIWDGQNFVFETYEGSSWWWDVSKMWWKYGLAPYRAVKLVQSVISRFTQMYEAPHFPFSSLSEKAFELGLLDVTGVTGEQFLAQNNIDGRFGREILQAATRVNYASNLAYIHGLETMVSFATDGAVVVKGGNWQIFDRMVRTSGASLYRNTSVASISTAQNESDTSPPKYLISTRDSRVESSSPEKYAIGFDNVIVASPWQFSHISAEEGILRRDIDEIPYTKLHVTLLASPLKLSPEFFGLRPGSKAPSSVYTTLAEDEEPKKGADGVGRTGFYSVSTLGNVVNPKTGKLEFVYKIFSAQPVASEFLAKLFGTEIPDTFVGVKGEEGNEAIVQPISWYYPHWFYSYPIMLPRVTFQDPIVGDGVYYTSGIESFISTMETSALMGKNVAKLIANDFAGRSQKGTEAAPSELVNEVVGDKEETIQEQGPAEL
ncbi:hypothetical protein B0J13DRAFT_544830 [Dactylonectria estremocensis]|uniref:Prenylcysteine lyase domain-containing protein n=1 Tax=Dactylonectria estremocensis TaxID=1079267 RepID=A0A9P9F874_9HYPO|nr:hypothetical protein B0J13DRAFT_544830 [Dactylonectria estremocensis]